MVIPEELKPEWPNNGSVADYKYFPLLFHLPFCRSGQGRPLSPETLSDF